MDILCCLALVSLLIIALSILYMQQNSKQETIAYSADSPNADYLNTAMDQKGFCSEFVVAAEKGDIEKVKKLFEIVCTLSAKNEQCYYALYFSALNGHENVVEFLLSQNVDPNFAVGSYLTPLHAAVFSKEQRRHAEFELRYAYMREKKTLPKFSENIVSILLNYGANVNPKMKVSSGEETVESSYFCSPLHAAVYSKDDKAVEILLKRGAIVNEKILPAINNDSEDNDDDDGSDDSDDFDNDASRACKSNGQRYEMEEDFDFNIPFPLKAKLTNIQSNPSKPVIEKSEQEKKFEAALNYGVFSSSEISSKIGPGYRNYTGFTSLHIAIDKGKVNILKMLVNNGANVNDRLKKDLTPLAYACERNEVSLVKILLAAGADLKTEVSNGSHLLRYILRKRFHRSLGNGDYYGYNAKKSQEENKVFNYLLQIGVDPNGWSSRKKDNVIHYAANNGMYYAVHLLLKYGANSNCVDGESTTPLEYAVSNLEDVLKQVQDEYCYEPETSSSDDNKQFSDSAEEEAYEQEVERRRKARKLSRKRQFKNRTIYNLSHSKYKYNKYKYRRDLDDDCVGFEAMQDPDVHRMIAQLLTRDLVRLEARGTRIIQQNVKLLETPFVKPFYTECKNEVEKLKSHLLVNGVSYYDFLQADDKKLQEYMKNKNIVDLVTGDDCQKLFPNYCRFLRVNANRGLKQNSVKN